MSYAFELGVKIAGSMPWKDMGRSAARYAGYGAAGGAGLGATTELLNKNHGTHDNKTRLKQILKSMGAGALGGGVIGGAAGAGTRLGQEFIGSISHNRGGAGMPFRDATGAVKTSAAVAKRAALEEIGETVVKGLNRIAPKSKPGLNLMHAGGLGKRLTSMEAKYGGPGASEHRTKMINSIREKARATRMRRIGGGALAGGGALVANGVANDQKQKKEAGLDSLSRLKAILPVKPKPLSALEQLLKMVPPKPKMEKLFSPSRLSVGGLDTNPLQKG